MPKRTVLLIVFVIATTWTAISSVSFALRNPCLTQTELLLHMEDALLWSVHDFCRDKRLYYPPEWAR